MKVILRQDVVKLGKSGDVVKVKDGYGRNLLIPKGLAMAATKANLNRLTQENKKKSLISEKEKKQALEQVSRLEGLSINVAVEAQEEDKLYGSVTSVEIAHALEAEGVTIDKNAIILDQPIKTLGIFDCTVKPHPEVEAKIKVWVVRK